LSQAERRCLQRRLVAASVELTAAWRARQELCALLERSGEYCLAMRSRRAYAERLVAQPAPAPRPARAAGLAAVVTGGTQGLGLACAKQVPPSTCHLFLAFAT